MSDSYLEELNSNAVKSFFQSIFSGAPLFHFMQTIKVGHSLTDDQDAFAVNGIIVELIKPLLMNSE